MKFQNNAAKYLLTKPILIGEFAAGQSEGQSIQTLMDYAYANGYAVRKIENFNYMKTQEIKGIES